MSKKHREIKKELKKNARTKIAEFFLLAENVFDTDKKKANMYVRKARNLGMKYKIRISSAIQRRFCKHCYSFLVPGKNLRVRTHNGHVVYYCLECKRFTRFPYRK